MVGQGTPCKRTDHVVAAGHLRQAKRALSRSGEEEQAMVPCQERHVMLREVITEEAGRIRQL